jgi:hypothetical protein
LQWRKLRLVCMTALYSPVVTICTAKSNIKSLHVIHKECLCNLTLTITTLTGLYLHWQLCSL